LSAMLNAAPSIYSLPVRVLAIDGHQIVLFSILHMLSGSGYSVCEASSLRQGLELAQEHPDVILLDINLPDGSGIDLCRRLKASPETRSIPVILISHAYDAEQVRRSVAEAGAESLIEFPLTPAKLITQISQALENKKIVEIRTDAHT